jgi:aryl-alcohol dehydrogenase-like predicted oxidoreductase
MKLAIGTVQFGLQYGIANKTGQISEKEARKILKYAKEANIDTIDTAIGYGNSEYCLGSIGVDGWNVVTKIPEIPKGCLNVTSWINEKLKQSLNRLGVNSVKGLMLHRPMQLLETVGEEIWQTLKELKQKKMVKKIGFSIYEPDELDKLWYNFKPEIVQAPYNIFDQRLKESGWMKKLYENNVEIHVRSLFLQGLLLMNSRSRPEKFNQWESLWEEWDQWLDQQQLTPLEAALGFVLKETMVDRAIVGVDSLAHLKGIISSSNIQMDNTSHNLKITDHNLFNPANWSKL